MFFGELLRGRIDGRAGVRSDLCGGVFRRAAPELLRSGAYKAASRALGSYQSAAQELGGFSKRRPSSGQLVVQLGWWCARAYGEDGAAICMRTEVLLLG